MNTKSLDDQLADSLRYEATFDVAVFCLVIAGKLSKGEPCASKLHADLPQEWAMAARHLVTDETTAFEMGRVRRALKELVE